jgi:uncharacterized damage-inducible protein DinB
LDLLERLLAHDRWATNVLFDTCAPLTDDQFGQPFDIGHESIHATFGHLIFNIEAWTSQLREQPLDRSNDDWSRANLRSRWELAFDAFEALALELQSENRLDDTFTDSWEQPQTNGAAILHVILHDDEHRQEILHILKRLGVDPVPEIDHALWDFVRRGLFNPGEDTQ